MKHGVVKVHCKCDSEQQDKLHGKSIRVANTTAKQDTTFVVVRCTVCNTLHKVHPQQVK